MKHTLYQTSLFPMIVAVAFIGLMPFIVRFAQQQLQQQTGHSVSMSSSNRLDPSTNKPGDIIAGMTLRSISPAVDTTSTPSTDNVSATFKGTTTVSGTYQFSHSEFSGENMVCMFISDPVELAKLPRLSSDTDPRVEFCFKNISFAQTAFGPRYGEGVATVTISDYELNNAPAEVLNQATLLNVVSRQPTP